ncbi:alanyl-tRNA synthetase [Candidatus Terasakiella magnetica]|uniref:Alanine--tRNA ligase n=1 Tax=Candidatus Terasakiella magnetica TaxID=1867952 RepID=A0A1C3RL00_9PROT|nr:alanine--tRNA ligase [Candidatus Terasakiella magnetica]SCA57911.1 alanyl-tRNA synthetase [Candidatus Terasakiella magnetica]
MQSANDIRKTFLEYFGKNGHEIVDSSPLVPRNDPTLMFTNAGMVQFKNVFTGVEKREYSRATTSQKCVRAGGKHNDLENVGFTARHHTFFEMLGNFSFGDYFKDNAIELAWNLITKEFGLPKDKLLVTVYHEDDEAFDLWKKIAGLSDDKIIRIPTSDNFWAMGDTGPCGPCSEIFFDHGDHIWGGPPGSPEEDGDRFIEIWNLVFMQYEQTADERLNLPKPSIDTGMGLERIAAVMQGTHDNYNVDLLRKLIEASADKSSTDADGDFNTSHRVIADHLRSSAFLLADGVLPSNEGRGYVLRRIMRRAMRHAHIIGAKDPLLHKLVPTLTSLMGQAFPELTRAEALITETLELEEARFKKLLDRGLSLLDAETKELGEGDELKGDVAFKLYDTYGFPVDLTQDALKPKNIGVDMDGFETAMEKQRAEARKNWSGSGGQADEALWFDLKEKVGATDFLGYDTETAEGQIVSIVVDGKEVDRAQPGTEVIVLLNQTPFYAESGGQEGDKGLLKVGDIAEVEISDTQKRIHSLYLHVGKVKGGVISVGEDVSAEVDNTRRSSIRSNHSATHLLHKALQQELGDHVTQKGSLVAEERLRFDIAHNKGLSAEEIAAVEAKVNAQVRSNTEVVTRLMTPDEAIEQGAMALFGEKYGDEVRVVAMGDEAGKNFSVELCGGTHVKRTGDIGLFKVLSEGAVAAGVRRIEALTGSAAVAYLAEQEERLNETAALLKSTPAKVASRVEALLDERKKMEREIADLRKKLATGGASGSASEVKEVEGVKYMGKVLDGIPGKELKSMVDEMKNQIGSGICAAISVNDGKASLVVGVTDDLKDSHSAVDLVRAGSAAVGGKGGGGRPDMAQAGGPDGDKADAALAAIEAAIAG